MSKVTVMDETISFAQLHSPARERTPGVQHRDARREDESSAERAGTLLVCDRSVSAICCRTSRVNSNHGGRYAHRKACDRARRVQRKTTQRWLWLWLGDHRARRNVAVRRHAQESGSQQCSEQALVRASVELADSYVGTSTRAERAVTATRIQQALLREKRRLVKQIDDIQNSLDDEHASFVKKSTESSTAAIPSMKELRDFESKLQSAWMRLEAMPPSSASASASSASSAMRLKSVSFVHRGKKMTTIASNTTAPPRTFSCRGKKGEGNAVATGDRSRLGLEVISRSPGYYLMGICIINREFQTAVPITFF